MWVRLVIFGGVFLLRTINEWNAASRERQMAHAFYVAEAAGDAGLFKLDELVNTDLFSTINAYISVESILPHFNEAPQ